MINSRYLENVILDLSKEDAILLVEGRRDTEALTSVGIKKEVIVESAQKSNIDIENVITRKKKTVIPLFDNDNAGNERFKKFLEYFGGYISDIDISYSRKLKLAGVTYIEEIDNVLG